MNPSADTVRMERTGGRHNGRLYAAILLSLLAMALAFIQTNFVAFILAIGGLLLLLLPGLLRNRLAWEMPEAFNFYVIALVYALIALDLLMDLLGIQWLFGAASQILAGAIMGLAGFILIHALLKERPSSIGLDAALVAFFTFALSLAFGAVWTLLQFGLDMILHTNLEKDLVTVIGGLLGVAIGSIPISIMAYYHIKHDKAALMGKVLRQASSVNQDLLGDNRISRPEAVRQMINRGESVDQEFKGSLRTNLKTGEVDKRMEQAVLKTITAFLNSDGGTLFIGVNDDGSARGIDVQHFDNQDKFLLHFTNLVNETIGKRFIPFVEMRLVDLEGATIMAVRCSRCNVPAFLKMDKEEMFYVRAGASSSELRGREMIDYINQRFRA
jgi:hypothetical protein